MQDENNILPAEHPNANIDTRRRMLLGGVAGAVAAALLTPACKQKAAPEVVEATQAVTPETVGPVNSGPDVNIPPGMQALAAEELAYATRFLTNNISVDVHCHPGMFFFEGTQPEDPMLAKMASVSGFQNQTMTDMSVGGLSLALFSTVADIRLIGAGKQGLFARREFEEGEAYQNHLQQLATLNKMMEFDSVAQARTPADVIAAKQAGKTAAVFSCEGGDFIEERIERLEEAWQAGIRSICPVHYHVNQMGDIQTASPVHNGLTDFGKQTVREMNRLGMIVDLAHASYQTAMDACAITTQPLMVSHSFLANDDIQNPRLLSKDHALAVAGTGGVIGAWPAGIGTKDFQGFISHLLRLVDVVGIDHVSFGTDMDANYMPVFTNYRQMPYMPAVLKRHGMNDEDIAKVLGGNFMRVFSKVTESGVHA